MSNWQFTDPGGAGHCSSVAWADNSLWFPMLMRLDQEFSVSAEPTIRPGGPELECDDRTRGYQSVRQGTVG